VQDETVKIDDERKATRDVNFENDPKPDDAGQGGTEDLANDVAPNEEEESGFVRLTEIEDEKSPVPNSLDTLPTRHGDFSDDGQSQSADDEIVEKYIAPNKKWEKALRRYWEWTVSIDDAYLLFLYFKDKITDLWDTPMAYNYYSKDMSIATWAARFNILLIEHGKSLSLSRSWPEPTIERSLHVLLQYGAFSYPDRAEQLFRRVKSQTDKERLRQRPGIPSLRGSFEYQHWGDVLENHDAHLVYAIFKYKPLCYQNSDAFVRRY